MKNTFLGDQNHFVETPEQERQNCFTISWQMPVRVGESSFKNRRMIENSCWELLVTGSVRQNTITWSAQSFIYRPACLLSDSSWTQANWTFNPEEMRGCCDVLRSPPYIGTRLRACRNHISFQPPAMSRLAPKSQTSLFFRADFMVLRCEGVHSSWCLVLADAELGFAPSRETNRREQPPVHSQGGGATARWGAPPTQLEAISDPLRLQFLTFLWPPPPEVSTWVMSAQEKQGGSFPWPLPEWVRRHVCVGGGVLNRKEAEKQQKPADALSQPQTDAHSL